MLDNVLRREIFLSIFPKMPRTMLIKSQITETHNITLHVINDTTPAMGTSTQTRRNMTKRKMFTSYVHVHHQSQDGSTIHVGKGVQHPRQIYVQVYLALRRMQLG